MEAGLEGLGDRERAADGAYRLLRRAVLEHRLLPGTRLSVPALAEQLRVSRSPVREAVQRLVREGLASEQPHRGAVVIELSIEELLPIYEIREALEGLAARLAAIRLTTPEMEAMQRTLKEHRAAVRAEDLERHFAADMRLHGLIRTAAGNKELSDYLDQLQGKIQVAMLSTSVTAGAEQALMDHERIVAALAAREPEEAERSARAHIARLGDTLAGRVGTDTRRVGTDTRLPA